MAGRVDQVTHSASIAKWEDRSISPERIRQELASILQSPSFNSSQRSSRFLSFIVGNAIEHRFDQLKERTIGLELFDRPADYDTNTDSIVRVTATDVRKRLFEYYASSGRSSSIRISLPQGSYLPEVDLAPATATPVTAIPIPSPSPASRRWLAPTAILSVAALAALAFAFRPQPATPSQALIWGSLFHPAHRTNIVLADTSVAAVQDLLDIRIKLSDYASGRWPSPASKLDPGLTRARDLLERNHFTSTADAAIAARLSQNFGAHAASVHVVPAASMQIRSFHTADNFILIGSSRANPWVELFSENLGLSIEFDDQLKRQVCIDRRASSGQPARYVPTARTGGAGEAFAVLALVKNPGQSGHALLLAGTSMEGTETAGEFAADTTRLKAALDQAGILQSNGTPEPFEALLKLKSLAGSASSFEIVLARKLTR